MEEQPVNNQIQQAPVNSVAPKPNYWMIAAIVLLVIVVIGGVNTLSIKSQKDISIPPSPISSPTTISQPSPTPFFNMLKSVKHLASGALT